MEICILSFQKVFETTKKRRFNENLTCLFDIFLPSKCFNIF